MRPAICTGMDGCAQVARMQRQTGRYAQMHGRIAFRGWPGLLALRHNFFLCGRSFGILLSNIGLQNEGNMTRSHGTEQMASLMWPSWHRLLRTKLKNGTMSRIPVLLVMKIPATSR